MRFTIRDLIFVTALVGLVIARFLDQAATRERELVLERLAHKIDADVHDHLKEVSTRLVALEGWAESIDRRNDEDGRRGVAIDAAISELITDVGALQGKWPARKGAK